MYTYLHKNITYVITAINDSYFSYVCLNYNYRLNANIIYRIMHRKRRKTRRAEACSQEQRPNKRGTVPSSTRISGIIRDSAEYDYIYIVTYLTYYLRVRCRSLGAQRCTLHSALTTGKLILDGKFRYTVHMPTVWTIDLAIRCLSYQEAPTDQQRPSTT